MDDRTDKTCYCGTDYSGRGHKAKTCGAGECLKLHYQLLRERTAGERNARRRARRAAARPDREPTARPCAYCGASMQRHPNARYCSVACKRKAFISARPEYHSDWNKGRRQRVPVTAEKQAIYNKNRRARRRYIRDSLPISPKAWDKALRKSRGVCAYCGATKSALTMEHVIPLVRGGRHAEGNVIPVCLPCNRLKAHMLLSEWKRHPNYARRLNATDQP